MDALQESQKKNGLEIHSLRKTNQSKDSERTLDGRNPANHLMW